MRLVCGGSGDLVLWGCGCSIVDRVPKDVCDTYLRFHDASI